MGLFRLVLAQAHRPEPPRLMAEHLNPGWLKQRGYEIARSLGDEDALWTAQESRGRHQALTLRCRSGHTLAIITE